MKAVRLLVVLCMLLGGLGLTACASRGGGCGCNGGTCKCAPDRNCCDGCRQGTGCTCNR